MLKFISIHLERQGDSASHSQMLQQGLQELQKWHELGRQALVQSLLKLSFVFIG
jgi:hypothetical protein